MHERNYEHRWAPTALSLAISEIAFGVAYVSHIPSLQGGLRDVFRRSPYHILFHRLSLLLCTITLRYRVSLFPTIPLFFHRSRLSALILSDHHHFQGKLVIARYCATNGFPENPS